MDRKVKKNPQYQELRARLIRNGTNLSRWARLHGYPLMTVYCAARGQRHGITSAKIRRELEKETSHGR